MTSGSLKGFELGFCACNYDHRAALARRIVSRDDKV
jgi:hypothetical protein